MSTGPRAAAAPQDPDGGPPHTRPRLVAAVAAGGCVGAPLRYGLAQLLPGPASGWPTATFVTNLLGALALGLLLSALAAAGPDTGGRRALRLGLGTGLVGAFTTYSTFVVEVVDLARAGSPATAMAYALGTVAAGALLAALGLWAGAALRRRGRSRS